MGSRADREPLAPPTHSHLSLAAPCPRIVEVEQDNKMTPGNLGIVFGPTLLRPRPTEATVSLSSLVDYPHQARVIETLIVHFGLIFEEEPEEAPGGQVEKGCGVGALRLWVATQTVIGGSRTWLNSRTPA